MTDAEKLEKVIKGLECCVVGAECDHCKYGMLNKNDFEGCRQMLADALALLKAQEPRVMEWQEIVDSATQMPFIWLESKENHERVFQSILFKTWLFDSTVTIITVMTRGWLFEGYQVNYNKTWRCWTSRPDEKRRTEAPWN